MPERVNKKVPADRLSRAEWLLMRTCWSLARPANVHQILDEHPTVIAYRTAKTYLDRMELKGYLHATYDGRIKYYQPVVAREAALRREIDRFLEDVIGDEPEGLALLHQRLARRS